ncbi:MAG: helix-turn-helix transcriptional regulator [Hyphomonadaceae bacterium]|nr:helix-turn-helix transcriptional regulator [Hyphomonadaceae bacterium]
MNTLSELLDAEGITAAELARRIGCGKSYLSRVKNGKPLSRPAAIKIFHQTGRKIGPIAGATDEEILAFEKFSARQVAA